MRNLKFFALYLVVASIMSPLFMLSIQKLFYFIAYGALGPIATIFVFPIDLLSRMSAWIGMSSIGFLTMGTLWYLRIAMIPVIGWVVWARIKDSRHKWLIILPVGGGILDRFARMIFPLDGSPEKHSTTAEQIQSFETNMQMGIYVNDASAILIFLGLVICLFVRGKMTLTADNESPRPDGKAQAEIDNLPDRDDPATLHDGAICQKCGVRYQMNINSSRPWLCRECKKL